MDVIYYYCFLFYTKIIKDEEPFATTVWAIGIAEGFFTSVIVDLSSTYFYCFHTTKWVMISVGIVFLIINYLYFNKSGRSRILVKEKPMFYNSQKISIAITIIFFTILISSMFWGAPLSRYLMETHCK